MAPQKIDATIASGNERNSDLPLRGGNGDRHSFIRAIAFDIHKSVVMNFVGGFTEGIVEVAENLPQRKREGFEPK